MQFSILLFHRNHWKGKLRVHTFSSSKALKKYRDMFLRRKYVLDSYKSRWVTNVLVLYQIHIFIDFYPLKIWTQNARKSQNKDMYLLFLEVLWSLEHTNSEPISISRPPFKNHIKGPCKSNLEQYFCLY